MKIKFKKFIKMYESPDTISYDILQDVNIDTIGDLRWHQDDAASFGYYDDKFLISDFGSTHDELLKSKNVNNFTHFGHTPNINSSREHMEYPGRLWLDSKVITFWEYPDNYDDLKKIINDINRVSEIKIDDNWWIEVIFKNDEQVINKYKFWGDSEMDGDERYINDSKLIKVGDYKGSSKRSKEELKLNHLKVGSGGIITGFGSDYYNDNNKLPSGMSQAEYRNKKTKYKFTESFNSFLKLNESPNYVEKYDLTYDKGRPFSYYNNELVVGDFYQTHNSLFNTYNNDEKIDDELALKIGLRSGRGELSGRLFPSKQIITFWTFPKDNDEMKKIADDIKIKSGDNIWKNNWKVEILKNENDGMYEYWWENDDVDFIPVEDYKFSNERSQDEIKIPHLMKYADKEKYYKEKGKTKGFGSDKLKDIRWKNALGKFRGESVQFTYNDQLNTKFWKNYLFDERIREKLITIANEFYRDFDYGDASIEDIILTGSLANFNYNKFSDLDVHVLIDFSKINKDINLVKKAVDGYRFMWNLRHNITIKGHDVELYIQNINEPHTASGLYSLMNVEWINKPKYNQPKIDKELVNFKFLTYMSGIEKLIEISHRNITSEIAMKYYLFATNYKSKIMKGRKFGLETNGEFSIENLVFKKLRNSEYFEKLINVIVVFYDKIYSQN